jgi:hypothetical protein
MAVLLWRQRTSANRQTPTFGLRVRDKDGLVDIRSTREHAVSMARANFTSCDDRFTAPVRLADTYNSCPHSGRRPNCSSTSTNGIRML